MKQYTITQNEMTGTNTTMLLLAPETGNRVKYRAGQYVAVGFRNGWRRSPVRCFSVTTAPTESGELGIAFRREGAFTSAFSSLEPGSQVEVAGAFGDFTIGSDETRPLLFLAGGIGITPFMSMLRDLQSRRVKQAVTLLYSCRTLQDVPFARELIDLAKRNKNFTVRIVVKTVPAENTQLDLRGNRTISRSTTSDSSDSLSGENEPYRFIDERKLTAGHRETSLEWGESPRKSSQHPLLLQGSLNEDILSRFSTADTQYYVCGPSGYVAHCQRLLGIRGVRPGAIHSEAFSQVHRLTIAGFAVQKLVYGMLAFAILAGAGLLMLKDVLGKQEASSQTSQSGAYSNAAQVDGTSTQAPQPPSSAQTYSSPSYNTAPTSTTYNSSSSSQYNTPQYQSPRSTMS